MHFTVVLPDLRRSVRVSTVTDDGSRISDLPLLTCAEYLAFDAYFVLCNGKKVEPHSLLEDGRTYHMVPRILGGKGGFGSMLRAIGAQIEKTTSREACRDLSGRRMRDINNEKKLKDWLAKEAEREKEKEERKRDRLARHLASSQHKFDDDEYHEQRAKVHEDLEDALHKGFKRVKNSEKDGASSSKKAKLSKPSKSEWLGMELDSDDLASDSEADPGSSLEQTTSLSSTSASISESRGKITNCDTEKLSEEPNSIDGACCGSTTEENGKSLRHEIVQDKHSGDKNEFRESVTEFSSSNGDEETNKPSHGLSTDPIDLASYHSESQLRELGLERLKHALMTRGLKCGGTLEERAQRLFSVKGLSETEIDPSLFAKSKGKGKKSKQL